MDPFTQHILDRARARREKIDSKLASNGESVTPRKPLVENKCTPATKTTSVLSPEKKADVSTTRKKDVVLSPERKNDSPVYANRKVDSRRTSKDAESPAKSHIYTKSPGRRTSTETKDVYVKSPARRGSQNSKCHGDIHKTNSPRRNDLREVQVTKTAYYGELGREERNSDVSVEINIVHHNDVQIEVQVEERDAPMAVYGPADGVRVDIREIEEDTYRSADKENRQDGRTGLRQNAKARLDRLGVLYSDKPELSSPIHRTEQEFTSATPPRPGAPPDERPAGKRKLPRLAALADTINNWEDDTSHHLCKQAPEAKKPAKQWARPEPARGSRTEPALDASTLDVSIHSLRDIGKVIESSARSPKTGGKGSPVKSAAYTRTCDKAAASIPLNRNMVASLEAAGYRRENADQSRLVYDFGPRHRQEPGATATPSGSRGKMAAAVAPQVHLSKKPSVKKYKAPTPPRASEPDAERPEPPARDDDNNHLPGEPNGNDVTECAREDTSERPIGDEEAANRGSPLTRKVAAKLNGHVDRNSVLSKAAMFESGGAGGSPRARDPAEMSIRERKALFEKNKGAAIVPKAPFGQAPSARVLQGDVKATPIKPVASSGPAKTASVPASAAPKSASGSREDLPPDGAAVGGIKGKLAALFSKEQTISESTIADKFKRERRQELEMLQNRFQFKSKRSPNPAASDSEEEHDPSERAPLMGSSVSLTVHGGRRPEIIANVPKVTFREHKCKSETALHARDDEDRVIGSQPVKRRSSQDSPVVLSVLEDVKRIKVHKKETANGAPHGSVEPASIYPHLSDIETATSSGREEESDCGGSSVESCSDNRLKSRLNISGSWAETSFGRDMMQVVKKSEYKPSKLYRTARDASASDSDSSVDTDMEDGLDEALDEELAGEADGPTPPKLNKNCNSLSSKSFTYKECSPARPPADRAGFKSPLKLPATPAATGKEELVHSVSFYRRMQSASSTPTTPVRVVRHAAEEERERPAPEEEDRVTTLRQRVQELQQEISKQQTVISQASQALNLCAATVEFSGSTEQAEGERLLLLATHRRQACLHEVQRLQVEGPGPAATRGCASLLIKDITVPLRRDYVRLLNADGAVGHHCVCLLKCRDRVIATSMQLTQPTSHLLHFPDQIRMQGLASDFKVTVEVYMLQASKELLPHDVKYHISGKKSSSKLLTPKGKVSELKAPRVQSPAGPAAVRSPQLQPHGYCIFAIQQAERTSFTLNKVPHSSPLEGSINVSITARVSVPPPPPHAAFLTAFDDVSGLGAWHRRWCVLQGARLSYWKYPDDVRKKLPMGDLDLATVTSSAVTRAPRDLCARPNTLLLETSVPAGLVVPESGSLVYRATADGGVVRRHLLAADTQHERDVWLESLNGALEYVRCSPGDE